jgi:hypothetical protein
MHQEPTTREHLQSHSSTANECHLKTADLKDFVTNQSHVSIIAALPHSGGPLPFQFRTDAESRILFWSGCNLSQHFEYLEDESRLVFTLLSILPSRNFLDSLQKLP